jgi:hypothetical protein
MCARGEASVPAVANATISDKSPFVGPVRSPPSTFSKPREAIQQESMGFTFGSVRQVPVKRKALPASSSSRSARSEPSSEDEPEFQGVTTASSDGLPMPSFPSEVMEHSERRKILSLLLQALRRHLEFRLSKHAKKRSKIDDFGVMDEAEAAPMAPAEVTALAISVEAALFRLDGSCSEVRHLLMFTIRC